MKRIEQDEIAAAYHDMAASRAGQIVLADLEARFGWTTKTMFDQRDVSGLLLAYREGSRSVLAHMGRMIETPILQEDRSKAET
jgi:hypothetical protein